MKYRCHPFNGRPSRRGSVLFYAMGTLTLLSLLALTALTGATLESRSARLQVFEMRAMAHAEAGAEVVRRNVELGLEAGNTLEEVLATLSVSPPTGVDFEVIDTFRIMVPGRIFAFESVGRSGNASVRLAVQFRRKEMLESGIYGMNTLRTQPNLNVYGYDSRYVNDPTPSDSNGGVMIGSSEQVDLGNGLNLDGIVVMSEDLNGDIGTCSGCMDEEVVEVEYVEPDPLGANNEGPLAQKLEEVRLANDNDSNGAINNNTLRTKPGDQVTFTSGDYYFTDIKTSPDTEVYIDDSDGPVRFFVEGETYFAPNNGLPLNDPFSFQIYSFTDDPVRIQPNGDLSIFAYAPNGPIELWPNGKLMGGFWGNEVQFQPGGDFYVDTSLQDRILSNTLKTHAKYGHRSR